MNQTIPTEEELSSQYQASRTAIREALKSLEDNGLLKSIQGKNGRWVTPKSQSYRETIGLLARSDSDFAGGQGSYFFSSLNRIAAEMGYSFSANSTVSDEQDHITVSVADLNKFDATIVYTGSYAPEDIRNLSSFMPTISMPNDATSVGVPSFFLDFGYHAAMAVSKLFAAGHHRIGLMFCDKPERIRITVSVRRGFDMARMFHQLPMDESLVWGYLVSDGATDAEYGFLYDRWKNTQHRPTAIISSSSSPLMGMMLAARNEGVNLPDHLSLVCLNDLSHDRSESAKLSHFVVPVEKMAREAMNCIDQMLNNQPSLKYDNPYYGTFEPAETFRALDNLKI